MACDFSVGVCFNLSKRAASISLIWPSTKCKRAKSRPISARAFGGTGVPSGVRNVGSSFVARCSVGLNPRIPSRARQPFIRLMIRVRSATRLSRSRWGRLPSSSSIVGIAAMLQ